MNKITAIVLAAGFSRRFGAENKLLASLDGQPLLERTLANLSKADLYQTLVVTGAGDEQISDICAARAINVVVNAAAKNGMGTSIADGVRASAPGSAFMIVLGDMPFIKPDTYAKIANSAARQSSDYAITFPQLSHPGSGLKRGHPVVFGPQYRAQLETLDGDRGAQSIITGNRPRWNRVLVDDQGILLDVDRPSDLES